MFKFGRSLMVVLTLSKVSSLSILLSYAASLLAQVISMAMVLLISIRVQVQALLVQLESTLAMGLSLGSNLLVLALLVVCALEQLLVHSIVIPTPILLTCLPQQALVVALKFLSSIPTLISWMHSLLSKRTSRAVFWLQPQLILN